MEKGKKVVKMILPSSLGGGGGRHLLLLLALLDVLSAKVGIGHGHDHQGRGFLVHAIFRKKKNRQNIWCQSLTDVFSQFFSSLHSVRIGSAISGG